MSEKNKKKTTKTGKTNKNGRQLILISLYTSFRPTNKKMLQQIHYSAVSNGGRFFYGGRGVGFFLFLLALL